MIQYRFYLKDNNATVPAFQEIDEPKGWDGVEINLVRSPTYEGLENIYSGELSFYNYEFSAFDIVVSAYDRDWFDADVTLKVTISCAGEIIDTIEGYLNFMTYDREGNEVTLQFEESSFARKFKNRIDTVIDLSKNTGVDGNLLSELNEVEILLHSKEIVLTVESDNDTPDFDKDTFQYIFEASGSNLSPPNQLWMSKQFTIEAGLDECDTKSQTFYIQFNPANPIVTDESLVDLYNIPNAVTDSMNAYGKVLQEGTVTIRVSIDIASWVWGQNGIGGFQDAKLCDCADGDALDGNRYWIDHFDYGIVCKIGSQTQSQGISSGDRSGCVDIFFGDMIGKNNVFANGVIVESLSDNIIRPFDATEQSMFNRKVRFVDNSYEFVFDNVSQDEDIVILIECNISAEFENRISDSAIRYYCEAYVGPGTSIEITSKTTKEPSRVNGVYIYEALNRVSEAITGQPDAIRSDYFGRTNSYPYSYDQIGCEALSIITLGKKIRRMLQKDGTEYPISTSFSELFQALNVHNNLGVRVERDGSEYRLRIEPKEYFYQRTSIFTATEPQALVEQIAKERLYNDFEVGYNQWEIENLNGIDEVNTRHFYSIPTTNIKSKLQQTTNYITGGYAIEMTRRIQYSSNPTTDWKYDDNKFIISLNRIEVESDQYTEDETTETYAIGTVSERDELFTTVDNLISPETAYNLRFSPARAAINWYKTLAPALLKKASSEIKFASGLGNVKMITELTEDCAVTNGLITEDQDISDDDTVFAGIEKIALYSPIWISFEYPLNYSEFVNLRDNSNKGITVICGDRAYFGFVEEINYKPNTSGGIADFKLLVANCYQGGFDSGFTQGFDITQC